MSFLQFHFWLDLKLFICFQRNTRNKEIIILLMIKTNNAMIDKKY